MRNIQLPDLATFVADEFTMHLGHGLTVTLDYEHAGRDYLLETRVRVFFGGQEIAKLANPLVGNDAVIWLLSVDTEPTGLARFLDAFGASGTEVVNHLFRLWRDIREASTDLPGTAHYAGNYWLYWTQPERQAKAQAAYDQWRWELQKALEPQLAEQA